jgi:hypothetical protein
MLTDSTSFIPAAEDNSRVKRKSELVFISLSLANFSCLRTRVVKIPLRIAIIKNNANFSISSVFSM